MCIAISVASWPSSLSVVSALISICFFAILIYCEWVARTGTRPHRHPPRTVLSPLVIYDENEASLLNFVRVSKSKRYGELWKCRQNASMYSQNGRAVLIRSREGMTRLRCWNPSNGEEIWLPVPPSCETAKEAAAWTYDVAPSKFSPDRV